MGEAGAREVAQSLIDGGVRVIFAIPGGAALPLFDALYESGLEIILMRHEQAAVHAADGYARRSGKPGVVIATSGPGGTNLLTGLATALADSSPVVALVAQVATAAIGTDAFQEADMLSMSIGACKHSIAVRCAGDCGGAVTEALAIAAAGRPGPVLVELPKDTQAGAAVDASRRRLRPRAAAEADANALHEAARLLSSAQRPVLYVGGGAVSSGAAQEVQAVCERLDAPAALTLMGLGALPGTHSHNLGMLGMHGSVTANWAVHHADVLLAVGTRFDDRVTGAKPQEFAPRAKVIHIDVDAAEIGKVRRIDVPILADAKAALARLLGEVPQGRRDAWWQTLRGWQDALPLRYRHGDDAVAVPYVLERLAALTDGEAVMTTEVGQHQMWAAQYYPVRAPRRFLTSGGLGTMGFGFPAAIGAALARDGLPVIAVCGDGSFQMNLQELATLAATQLPVKIIVLDNSGHGMVRQWQRLFYSGRYIADRLENPDFAAVAQAFGICGLRITGEHDVDDVLSEALAHPGPVLVDCKVSYEANVYPMIPAGGTVEDLVEDDGLAL